MISVTDKYKQAMEKPIRDRAYISVGIGVVNQDAQGDAKLDTSGAYWSDSDIFAGKTSNADYATMEQNFFRVDGSMMFMPEESATMQVLKTGFTSADLMGTVRITFTKKCAIKGLTIDFGFEYPTNFKVIVSDRELVFENHAEIFTTVEALGDTDFIEIIPISMRGGQNRLRIRNIIMGIGLVYQNQQTKDFSLDEYVSSISKELPSETVNYSFYDENGYFNVDDNNSFISFLETMQNVTVSFGVTLNDGIVEWNQFANVFLKDWNIKDGVVSITATDRLSQMEDEYSQAERIYQRSAYDEASLIFADAGLEPDEYYVDTYLKTIQINNPMPKGTHKECLQILANACRCIVRQDENGVTKIVPNFAVIFDPKEMLIDTNGVAEWSKPKNIVDGVTAEYADMTLNHTKANGSMYFLPENKEYIDTGYVSEQICDENGIFEVNPVISIAMPVSCTYFNLGVLFGGNPPKEIEIRTYKDNLLKSTFAYSDPKLNSEIIHEFSDFDKMEIEFTKGYPHNRVIVNKVSFSYLSDFVLSKSNMYHNPTGYKEKRVKSVKCKIFTFTLDEEGKPKQVDDNVYFEKIIGDAGETKTIENPLISTQEHAEIVADWVGNYYSNNISYDVSYRGDPRNSAADIIRMENDIIPNLQVEIEKHTLKFNGAFSGDMELRRALKNIV